MPLPREKSLAIGLATIGIVWAVYQSSMPSIADARVAAPDDEHLAATERTATITAAAIVAGVAYLAQDPTVFILGESTVVLMAWWHRHANFTNPSVDSTTPASRMLTDTSLATDAGYTPSLA